MGRTHEIVGRDLVVTDLVLFVCRKFGVTVPVPNQGLNIRHVGEQEESVLVIVEAVGWPDRKFWITLYKDPQAGTWNPQTLSIEFEGQASRGFKPPHARFEVSVTKDGYEFECTDPGHCHCRLTGKNKHEDL